jgi:hypothetical protein
MNANGNKTIKVGMTVIYRGSWGHDAPKQAKVESIELCPCEHCKYGDNVQEADIADIRRCVMDLSDGHWCYGYQIDEVKGFID